MSKITNSLGKKMEMLMQKELKRYLKSMEYPNLNADCVINYIN